MITNEALQALLVKRFRHYTPDLDFGFEQTEQPGLLSVAGHAYPVILLANDVFWFPSRESRPAREDGRSMKTKAPAGTRYVIVDEPAFDDLVLVEGEGDALAMRCVGYTGIAIAGGVNNCLSDTAEAVKNRKAIFTGKNIRLLFDNDDAGKKGAIKVARRLLSEGAVRVACIALPDVGDVEDWLEEFEDKSDALRALTHLIGGSSWETDAELKKQEADAEKDLPMVRTTSARIHVPGDRFPRLIVMTYEREKGKLLLAKFAPIDEPEISGYGDASIEPDVARGWSFGNDFEIAGVRYYPDRSDAVRDYLRFGTLVLPPPPVENVISSEELWGAVHSFVDRWVVVPKFAPDVMASYAFLTWRLEDACFRHVPYLRFFGPPGAGKGRALDVMRQICWRSFSTQPSSQNLHRIIDHMGDITLIIDEFHIDGKRSDSQQQIIDTLCYGYDRAQPVARVSMMRGKPDEIKNYKLFGPKVFAGYGSDEHEALARRSVTVEMEAGVSIPGEMSPLGLPEAFYAEGEKLRAQLLAWRGKNLTRGLPSPLTHPHAQSLIDRAGYEVGQVFFPLLAMVPEKLNEAREMILAYASRRRVAVRATRSVSDEAFLMEAFVNAATGPNGFQSDARFYATTQLVTDYLQDRTLTNAMIGRRLTGMGFAQVRPKKLWTSDGVRHRYYVLDPKAPHQQKLLERTGIKLPVNPLAKDVSVAGTAAL